MAKARKTTGYLDEHVHRQLRIKAAKEGTTISRLVGQAVRRSLREPREAHSEVGKERLKLDWAGALADLKDQYSSVSLQHESTKWRDE